MVAALFYLLAINIAGFVAMHVDKQEARRGSGSRIPEKQLMRLCALGGSAGVWLGMRAFRHKTRHASFVYGVPLLAVCNAVCLYAAFRIFG